MQMDPQLRKLLVMPQTQDLDVGFIRRRDMLDVPDSSARLVIAWQTPP
jgi:hypothetical protein